MFAHLQNTPVDLMEDQPTEKVVKVYPNPATTIVNFEFIKNYDKDNSIAIFNFIGKQVFEQPKVPSKLTLTVSDYYRGIYIYQIRDKSGRIMETGKFQVAK